MRWHLSVLAAVFAVPAVAADPPAPAAVAKRIDHHVAAKLAAAKVKPAAPADDATFLRRTYLLLVGRIPLPSEVHTFLEDPSPDKRAKLIDRLLDTPGYANHFTTVWRGWLVPEAMTNFEVAFQMPSFEAWLRDRLAANVGYDKLATELLTVEVNTSRQPQFAPYNSDGANARSPLAFYYAKAAKAENLAAASARVFLGVQLDCAQCHDHPFARWSRDQFWGLAGFFAGIEPITPDQPFGQLREILDRRELVIPNTDRVVQATFPDDTDPDWKPRASSRVTLAEWMVRKGNPFFARAAVNRVWGYVFGTGIVEPVDDFTPENLPSHPELLDELAGAFADSGFDLKFLLRALLLSDTYARDSAISDPEQADPRLFARFPVQGLTPEQLYASLSLIVSDGQEQNGAYLYNPGSTLRQFLDKFAQAGNRTEAPTSIVQALTLMNGELVAAATEPGRSRPVGVIVTLPGLTDEERIGLVYFTALGRPPKPAELSRAKEHVAQGTGGPHKRYGDLMWALLNGAEFRTNH